MKKACSVLLSVLLIFTMQLCVFAEAGEIGKRITTEVMSLKTATLLQAVLSSPLTVLIRFLSELLQSLTATLSVSR